MRKLKSIIHSSLLTSIALSAFGTGFGHTQETPQEIARAAVKAIFVDFDAEKAKDLLAEDYIQHNPAVPTGRAPILGLIPALKKSGIEVTTHRVLSEGDLVVFHSTYDNAALFGADSLVGFDVFRIENGKVAEHWDNLTPLTTQNPSGHSQTDGPTEVADRTKTAENKNLVAQFAETVLVGGKFDRAPDFISTERFTQHNSHIGDGLDSLKEAFAAMAARGQTVQYDTVHQIIADGNFVLTISEGQFAGRHSAFYDLFRVKDSKIVEHWDVVSENPGKSANNNGKFGSICNYSGSPRKMAGRSYKVNFGVKAFRLDFASRKKMTWAPITENGLGQPHTEAITMIEIRPDVYMVYWTEEAGNRVVHVEDFARGLVRTNIAGPDGGFLNLTGTLVEIEK